MPISESDHTRNEYASGTCSPSFEDNQEHFYMGEKVQLSHLLLDVDFLHKPTVVGFRRQFGYAAVTWLIEVYCQMSRARNALVTRDVILAIADDMRFESGNEMLSYCIEHGLIDQGGQNFTNSRVVKDQESLANKRKQAAERAQKYRDASRVTDPLRNGNETRFPDTVTDTDLCINNNREDLADSQRIATAPNPTPHFVEVGEFARISKLSYDLFVAAEGTNGKAVVDRALELVEGSVAQARNNPHTFADKRDKARNADGVLRAWALSRARIQITEEAAATSRLPEKKPEPKRYAATEDKPLEKTPPRTEEQKAADKKLLETKFPQLARKFA